MQSFFQWQYAQLKKLSSVTKEESENGCRDKNIIFSAKNI